MKRTVMVLGILLIGLLLVGIAGCGVPKEKLKSHQSVVNVGGEDFIIDGKAYSPSPPSRGEVVDFIVAKGDYSFKAEITDILIRSGNTYVVELDRGQGVGIVEVIEVGNGTGGSTPRSKARTFTILDGLKL